MCLKRPVYRGFKCEGWCFLPSPLPSPSHSSEWNPACLGFSGQQYTVSIPMLYCEYTYAILWVYLCDTIGTRVLYFFGTVFLKDLQFVHPCGMPRSDCVIMIRNRGMPDITSCIPLCFSLVCSFQVILVSLVFYAIIVVPNPWYG